MSVKALDLARRLMKPQLPSWSNIQEPGFVSVKNANGFGLTDPKYTAEMSALFSELNSKESKLLEKKDTLLKQLGPRMAWTYFETHLGDKDTVAAYKKIYDNVFENESAIASEEKALKVVEKPIVKTTEFNSILDQIKHRVQDIDEIVENEINPLLNPFGDFWTYGMDGPEFKDIFAARPLWNEVINQASDDMAFDWSIDNIGNRDVQENLRKSILDKLSLFVPNPNPKELIEEVANTSAQRNLLHHYTVAHLIPLEEANLHEYREDDYESLSARSAWISEESDPLGKHFDGH